MQIHIAPLCLDRQMQQHKTGFTAFMRQDDIHKQQIHDYVGFKHVSWLALYININLIKHVDVD